MLQVNHNQPTFHHYHLTNLSTTTGSYTTYVHLATWWPLSYQKDWSHMAAAQPLLNCTWETWQLLSCYWWLVLQGIISTGSPPWKLERTDSRNQYQQVLFYFFLFNWFSLGIMEKNRWKINKKTQEKKQKNNRNHGIEHQKHGQTWSTTNRQSAMAFSMDWNVCTLLNCCYKEPLCQPRELPGSLGSEPIHESVRVHGLLDTPRCQALWKKLQIR